MLVGGSRLSFSYFSRPDPTQFLALHLNAMAGYWMVTTYDLGTKRAWAWLVAAGETSQWTSRCSESAGSQLTVGRRGLGYGRGTTWRPTDSAAFPYPDWSGGRTAGRSVTDREHFPLLHRNAVACRLIAFNR